MSEALTPVETPSTTPVKAPRRNPYKTRAVRLARIKLAIDNAIADAGVQARLAPYGYTVEQLQQVQTLYQSVITIQRQKEHVDGTYRTTATTFEQAWQRAHVEYMRLIKVARVALADDPGTRVTLGIDGPRRRSFDDLVAQMQQFYENALDSADLLAVLAQNGIPQTRLVEAQAMLEQIITRRHSKSQSRGTSQQHTRDRNTAFRQLERWYSGFVTKARIALEQEPEWLEILGIVVSSK